MPLRIVNPGDLITATTWNDLAALVNNLEVRVAELEKGGKGSLRITQVLPTSDVTVGDTIRISGSGFDYRRGAHSVYFGSTRAIKFETDSSDNLLIVQIPDPVNGATPTGSPMTMTVGNAEDYTTWPLTIRSRPESTTGGIQFTSKGSRPATPTQNARVFYDFELKSFANRALAVTITPKIDIIRLPPGVTDPDLPRRLTVLDADGSERADRIIQLAEGATKQISLRLDLPNGTTGLQYSFSVTAGATGIRSVIEPVPDQEVGQPSEQPDSTVSVFEFASFDAPVGSFSTDTGGVIGVEGTLSIRRNVTATIEMRTAFSIPVGTKNSYQLAAAVEPAGSDWSAAPNAVLPNPLPITGPGGSSPTFFDITAPAATSSAILRLTVTRLGATRDNTRKVAYRLVTQ
jgi:hypothetical protein